LCAKAISIDQEAKGQKQNRVAQDKRQSSESRWDEQTNSWRAHTTKDNISSTDLTSIQVKTENQIPNL